MREVIHIRGIYYALPYLTQGMAMATSLVAMATASTHMVMTTPLIVVVHDQGMSATLVVLVQRWLNTLAMMLMVIWNTHHGDCCRELRLLVSAQRGKMNGWFHGTKHG